MSETATPLKAGARLRSQVCATEIIVVNVGSGSVVLTCGGQPMVGLSAAPTDSGSPAAGLDKGSVLGKRYSADADEQFEVLVTKAGEGTLANGDVPLTLKQAKALPASD
jgi:hypothetical protein